MLSSCSGKPEKLRNLKEQPQRPYSGKNKCGGKCDAGEFQDCKEFEMHFQDSGITKQSFTKHNITMVFSNNLIDCRKFLSRY